MKRPALPSAVDALDHATLRSIFQHTALGIALVDRQGFVVLTNPALQRLSGYSAEALRGMTLERVTLSDDVAASRARLEALFRGEAEEYAVENRYVRADGAILWLELVMSVLRDAAGRPEYALAMIQDVTQRKELEAALERERLHFERLFETTPEGIVLVDADDRVLRINPAFARLFGYEEREVLGQTIQELIVPEQHAGEALALTRAVTGGETVQLDTVRRHRDGSLLDVAVIGAPVRLHGERIAAYGIYHDIRDRKALERELRRLSVADELTGLLNRRGFHHEAERLLGLARRRKEHLLLCYIDLDGFKAVNDRYGHAAGDRLLRDVAGLLRGTVRSTDVVARLGGDEFAVLGMGGEHDAELCLTGRLQEAVGRYNASGEHPYPLAFSIGMHRVPAAQVGSLDELLAEADRRMYAAKEARKRTRRD